VAFADPNEIMFTPFEPKMKNRYIMELEGIPAYLINAVARPSVSFESVTLDHINTKRYVKGKATWSTLAITLYDPIVPSGAQSVNDWILDHHNATTGVDGYATEYKRDISINVLSPNGEKVEHWRLRGAFITEANFNTLDFTSNEPADISLTMQYDYAVLEF